MEGFSPAAQEKLAASGLTVEQAQMLGMYSVENSTILHSGFDGVPGLVIPYFDAKRQPMRAHPTWPDFFRVRYLNNVIGFAEAAGAKKQRYTQPPNTGVCAYLPLLADWAAIQADVAQPILITEGELKAAKATAEGFPCVGLGGVYNFRASARGVFFLPELELFIWPRRRVTIVYDSDYTSKPDICAAINVLAEELQERGAIVEVATLPDVYEDDRKTGLDDFLLARSDDGLLRLLKGAEPLTLVSSLWQMNEEVVYVANPGFVVDLGEGQKISPAAFKDHSRWATASVPERKVKPDGTVSTTKVSAAPAWLHWPLRRQARKVTYAPGQGRFTADNCYNQWTGWGCTPKKGDISPWTQLIKFIFTGAEPAFVEWFLDWCAYPLQNPGTKLYSAMVVHGDTTGTGKTLIGYTLGRIYGTNFAKITNKHLKREFNSWAENCQFALGDEISGSDKRSESDHLKNIITQEEMMINIKGIPEYSVPDCINYYFTSNHSDAIFLEDKDRRYAIHEVMHDTPLPEKFYTDFAKWRDKQGGAAALFYYLLNRDVSHFNPAAPAFQSAAKKRMTIHGKSDVGLWVAGLKEAPDQALRLGQMRHTRDLFTSAELLAMYEAQVGAVGKVTINGMSRALSAAGFRQAYGGNPIILGNGTQGRYFIARNPDKWRTYKVLKDLVRNIQQSPVKG